MYSHPPGLRDESAAEHNVAPRVTDDLLVAHRSLSKESQGTLEPRPRDARARSAARDVEAKTRVGEALHLYVKATGKDWAQKRQDLVDMKPGDLRRCLERWQERAEEVQRLQDKKEQVWELFRRQTSFKPKIREEFEEKHNLNHRVMHNNKADAKLLPGWTDELQSKVQAAERQLECREGKRMELEDSSSQRRRAWEKLWEP